MSKSEWAVGFNKQWHQLVAWAVSWVWKSISCSSSHLVAVGKYWVLLSKIHNFCPCFSRRPELFAWSLRSKKCGSIDYYWKLLSSSFEIAFCYRCPVNYAVRVPVLHREEQKAPVTDIVVFPKHRVGFWKTDSLKLSNEFKITIFFPVAKIDKVCSLHKAKCIHCWAIFMWMAVLELVE